jgi:DNA-binding NtrC family response regulator
MAQILVADDEAIVCESCRRVLEESGHQVQCAFSVANALEYLNEKVFDLALVDLLMPDRDGLELLKEIREGHSTIEVIIITGHSSIRSAVDAIKSGAYDYLPKPFSPEQLQMVVDQALEHQELQRENKYLRKELEILKGFNRLVGQSPKMLKVFDLIRRVATTESTVLIYGESGTGKELVARAIHDSSMRRGQRFVAVDCSTLPEGLLESELFGHMRGAFTGATVSKPGLFEVADKGSFFLDEVGQLPLPVQGNLLRVLQEREILPVGATHPRNVDVRIIAATLPDLEERLARGLFREDLYYRLHIVPIHLPPLRERREDIPVLAHSFLNDKFGESAEKGWSLKPGAMNKLLEYDWPGNVRELENTLERAAILADDGQIGPEHVVMSKEPTPVWDQDTAPKTNEELKVARKNARKEAISSLERAFVLEALERNNWNISKAAREVGIKRQNFQAMIRKLGIRR